MVGEARAGSLVAVVPGITYLRTQLTRMPNYPKARLCGVVRYSMHSTACKAGTGSEVQCTVQLTT